MTARTRDEDLLRRVSDGDRDAFHQLYDRYRPRLARFVARMIRRGDVAEEVVNDALLVVWQRADRFQGRSRPSTWILGIAYRVALKRVRSIARLAEEPVTDALRLVDPDEPDAELTRRQHDQRVRQALEGLSPQHRAVVELAFYEECSYPEIAVIVGCPENTVKTRMFYARKHLRRLMSPADAPDPR